MTWDKELRPWAHREESPAILKTLPKPAKEEFDFSDDGQAAFNRAALEQAELDRQRALESQIDERLTPEEIKQLYLEEQRKQNAADIQTTQYNAARTFTAECSEYVSTAQNAQRMADYLEAAGLRGTNVDDYHKAFRALNAAGLLKTKPAPAQPREEFTTAELYSMPMEQLENIVRNPGTVRITAAQGTRATRRKFGIR